jgi:hypothetical protein
MSGTSCVAGVCRTPCPVGYTRCGTSCVDTRVDRVNCGGCGITCGGGQTCNTGVCTDIAASACFAAMRSLNVNLARAFLDSRYTAENSGRVCLDWQVRTWQIDAASATVARRIDGETFGPLATQVVFNRMINGCMERVVVPTCLRERPSGVMVNSSTGEPMAASDARIVEIGIINMVDAACGIPMVSNGVNSITVDGESRPNSRYWAVPWSFPSGAHHLIVNIEGTLPARCNP